MYIYPFLKNTSDQLVLLEFPPDILYNIWIWNKDHWDNNSMNKVANAINVTPGHPYNYSSLNPSNLGLNLPDSGTLIFSHTSITAVLDPEDEEWYYNFSWGAAWYDGDKTILPKVNDTTLEDILLGLEVDFIEDISNYAPIPSQLMSDITGIPINLSSASNSGNVIMFNGNNYDWAPAQINIKI